MNPHHENEARNAAIIRLRGQGKSYGQIAAHFGLSRNVVAGVVNRAGLCRTVPPRFPENVRRAVVEDSYRLTWAEAARKHGVSKMSISNWRRQFDGAA